MDQVSIRNALYAAAELPEHVLRTDYPAFASRLAEIGSHGEAAKHVAERLHALVLELGVENGLPCLMREARNLALLGSSQRNLLDKLDLQITDYFSEENIGGLLQLSTNVVTRIINFCRSETQRRGGSLTLRQLLEEYTPEVFAQLPNVGKGTRRGLDDVLESDGYRLPRK